MRDSSECNRSRGSLPKLLRRIRGIRDFFGGGGGAKEWKENEGSYNTYTFHMNEDFLIE